MIEWLERRKRDRHELGSKPTPLCYVLGKDILRHFPLLGGVGKQFYVNFKKIQGIFWHLRRQVGIIARLLY